MSQHVYRLQSIKKQQQKALPTLSLEKMLKPSIHLDDIGQELNLFATDEARIHSQTVLFNDIIMAPLALFAAALSFVQSCRKHPIAKLEFWVMAATIWTVFVSVRTGIAWRSKVGMFWSILANLGVSSWAVVALHESISSDYLPSDSCSNIFWVFSMLLLVLPLLLTWKLAMYIRKILRHPDRNPHSVVKAKPQRVPKVNPRLAAQKPADAGPKQAASSSAAVEGRKRCGSEGVQQKNKDMEKPRSASLPSTHCTVSSADGPRFQKGGHEYTQQRPSGIKPQSSTPSTSSGLAVALPLGPRDAKMSAQRPPDVASAHTTSTAGQGGTADRTPNPDYCRFKPTNHRSSSVKVVGPRVSRTDILNQEEKKAGTRPKATPAGSRTSQVPKSPPRKTKES